MKALRYFWLIGSDRMTGMRAPPLKDKELWSTVLAIVLLAVVKVLAVLFGL